MARRCQVSGKATRAGNNVSHSNRHTRRVFKPNLVVRKIFLADENRWVKLKLSARMLRTLNKRGVKSLMKQYGQDLSVLKIKKQATGKADKAPQKAAKKPEAAAPQTPQEAPAAPAE